MYQDHDDLGEAEIHEKLLEAEHEATTTQRRYSLTDLKKRLEQCIGESLDL